MKKLLYILLFFSSYLIYGQGFSLAKPNVSKLKTQTSNGPKTEAIHYYLTNNYKSPSKKYDLEFYEWDKSKVCAFKEEFKNGIKYSVFECKEAGGVTVELELPKIGRTDLMHWIEQIYEVNKLKADQNIWKENNSKFEPKELVPGCYYKIKEKEKITYISLYCGC